MTLAVPVLLGACAKKVPPEHVDDRDRMTAAFNAFNEAVALSQPAAGQATISMTREDSIGRLLRLGLAKADSVDNAFLTWLHPEMPRRFRDHYVLGHRKLLEGIRTRNEALYGEGNQLVFTWHREFWDANKEAIGKQANP